MSCRVYSLPYSQAKATGQAVKSIPVPQKQMSQISTFSVPSIPSIMFGLERSTTFFQSQKTKFIGFNKAKESVCFLIIRPYALSHKANPYHGLSFSGKILSEKRFHLCVFCSPKQTIDPSSALLRKPSIYKD